MNIIKKLAEYWSDYPSYEDEEPALGGMDTTPQPAAQQTDPDVPAQYQHMKIVDFRRLEDDPNQQDDQDQAGLIRNVPGARLVFKRQQDDGTFEELWIYKVVPGLHSEVKIRKKILAGTDIPMRQTKSPDGDQSYKVWTAGDRQYLHIQGLPN